MRLAPAPLLLLALCLPTTANSKGGHGCSSNASRSRVTHYRSYTPVARDARGRIKRDPAARAAFQHRNSTIQRDARNSDARLSIVNVGWYI